MHKLSFVCILLQLTLLSLLLFSADDTGIINAMTNQAPQLPLSAEQLAQLQATTQDFSVTQLAWLSGYFWGRISGDNPAPAGTASPVAAAVDQAPTVTLISASQTGNARRLAD